MSKTYDPTTNEEKKENTGGWSAKTFLPEIDKRISENDPLGKDIFSIYQEVSEKIEKQKIGLEEKSIEFRNDAEIIKNKFNEYGEKIKRNDSWMIGIVCFFAITFITTIVLISLDSMKDKDLYSNYNNVYKTLIDNSVNQELKIKDLEYKIEILKAKNSYLK